jgi:hypothetical protein
LQAGDSRSGDDNFGVNELLVKGAVLALLVGGGHKGVALAFDPFSETKLVLGCSEELWNISGVLLAIVEDEENFSLEEQALLALCTNICEDAGQCGCVLPWQNERKGV